MSNDKELIVRKNNGIVKARYSLTTNETRVFLMMLYKLQAVDSTTFSCSIHHDEFKEIFKSKKDYTISNINNMLSELRRKPIYFKIPNRTQKGYTWGEYGFINGYTFNDETKMFTIEASQKIYEMVKNYLEDGYTPNNLAILFGIRNTYAHRLYDLIRVWTGAKNIINYSVDELRELLMLEEKYPLYADFKKRAIVPAVKELNGTGVIKIDIKENKIGRRVTSIDFIAKDFDKRSGFNPTFTEVPATFNEGGELKEFPQVAINTNAFIQEKSPAVAPAEALDLNKFVNYNDDSFFSPKLKEEFIKHCYDNLINFSDIDTNRILKESQQVMKDQKGVTRINNKSSYGYFMGIFKNKLEEDLNNFSINKVIAVGQAEPQEQEEIPTPADEEFKQLLKKYSPRKEKEGN